MADDKSTPDNDPIDPREALLHADIVQAHIQKAIRIVMEEARDRYYDDLARRLTLYDDEQSIGGKPLESPLEAIFEVWARVFYQTGRAEFYYARQVGVQGASGAKYRADFQAMYWRNPQPPVTLKVLIEVDGHGFHEKTPAQVAHRNKRDMDLSNAGYKIVHFSFSELNTDPQDCFFRLHQVLYPALHDALEAEGQTFQPKVPE